MSTLDEMEDRVLAHFNLDNSGSSSTARTRIRAYLNEGHRNILGRPGFKRCRHSTLTFASVASTPNVAVGQAIAQIVKITERTNDQPLERKSLDWYRTVEPDPTSTGTPSVWVPLGIVQVATQPSAASGLWVVSTAAETPTCYIEGVRTGGYLGSASVPMTGVTRAALGGASALTDWIEVTKFYISAAATGAVSLYDAATSGNELARIPIGRTFARYQQIALWPTPASAVTYYADVMREIPDMANANDEPLLPIDYHWVVEAYARMREYKRTDQLQEFRDERALFEQGVSQARNAVGNDPEYVVIPGDEHQGHSNLGPSFPSGVW